MKHIRGKINTIIVFVQVLSLLCLSCSICFAYSTKNNGPKIYETKHYLYIFRGKSIQILSGYSGKKTFKIPSKIKGYKVIKYGISSDDLCRNNLGEEIGYDAIGGVHSFKIKKLIIPDSIKEIGEFAFSGCRNLSKVVIGKGIKTVSLGAFKKCRKLKSIKLSSNIDEIDIGAFENSGLERVSISKNIKYIENRAFCNTSLNKITVSKKNKYFSSKNGILYNKKQTKLCVYPTKKKSTKFIVPKTVKEIDCDAFAYNCKLKKVVLPKNIKLINGWAFCNCYSLQKVIFNKSCKTSIEERAFIGCKALKHVDLPSKIKAIDKEAFGYKEYGTLGEDDYYTKKTKGFTIKGYKGSVAEKYAKKNKFKFVRIK